MRILVIGAGSIGQRHVRNLVTLGETDIWVYDHDVERMKGAARLGAKVPVTPSLETLQPDAVLICTPPQQHAAAACYWNYRGAAVFVEKPLADKLDGLDVLTELPYQTNRPIMVGYHMRFHKGLLNARYHWDEIGFPVRIDANFSQPFPDWRPGTDYRQNYLMTLEGGIILEQCHEIDYCRWLAGEVRAVECDATNTGEYGLVSFDTADIVLRHHIGTETHIHLDCTGKAVPAGFRTPRYLRDCHIQGTEGSIIWSYDGYLLLDNGERQIKRRANSGFNMGNRAYLDEMRHFLACCRGKAEPPVDGKEGVRVLTLALKCVESAKQGGRRIEV